MVIITETSAVESTDDAKKAIKNLISLQKRPMVIEDHKNTTSDVQIFDLIL
jgi:hypothetical protein